jgi:uncharacterized protein (DUF58 family)
LVETLLVHVPIPSLRLAVLMALGVLATAITVTLPDLLPVILGLQLLLVLVAFHDGARARRRELSAERDGPQMWVQGESAVAAVELTAARGQRIRWVEPLHPAVADAPQSDEIDDLRGTGGARTWRFEYRVTPRVRGDHECGPLTVRILGPLGLAWSQREVLPAMTVRVYPQVRWGGRVGQLLRLAQRNQLGHVTLARPGEGGELYSVRGYQPGDPRNRIHWRASARRDRLVTREDSWERGAPMVILLDCARAMATQAMGKSKLDYALAAALALARVAVSRGDRVTVLAFSDRIERRVRIRSTSRGIARAYGELFDLESRLVEPIYDHAAEQLLSLGLPRSTVVLFSSIVDLAAAEMLRDSLLRLGRRHRTLLVNLEDPVIEELARSAPDEVPQAFAKVSSLEILLENRKLAHRLRRGGVHTVSASADRLALETLEHYLGLFGASIQARAS